MKIPVSSSQTLVILMFLSTLTTAEPRLQQEAPPREEAASSRVESSATRSSLDTTVVVQPRPPTSSWKIATSQQTAKPSKIADNTWIESILIQVERMNLNNEQHKPHRQAVFQEAAGQVAEADSTRDQPQLNSSQAPTDSGEDPLEATTLTSTELSSNQRQNNATQYSLAIGDLNNNNNNNNSRQPLVGSNNVSSASEQQPAEQEQVSNRIVVDDTKQEPLMTHQTPPQPQVPKQPVACEQAYTQCAKRLACAPALKAYDEDCQDLISNRTNICSARCLRAMIALRSSDEGEDLVNCDCQANEYCQQSKQRSMACRPQVEEAVNPKTVVSCSTASWICMADQLCSTALGFYNRNCQSLFSQHYCSQRCNNSLSILYRQPKASKLISCHCDGSEEFPCVRYKTYTARLCLNIATPSIGDPQIDADDDNDQQASEEEGFNLTNDSDTFVLGPPSASASSSASTNNYSDYQDEYDDSRVAANDQESTSNGIHAVENNWIPLVSGRYFTNSHQQRQQQKAQKHHDQLSRQQNSTGSQQQHPRKSPKSVKQKPKTNSSAYHESNRPRRLRSRMFRFASSASSSTIHSLKRLPMQALVVVQQTLLFSLLFLLLR